MDNSPHIMFEHVGWWEGGGGRQGGRVYTEGGWGPIQKGLGPGPVQVFSLSPVNRETDRQTDTRLKTLLSRNFFGGR